ncbi:MAG TPA: methionine adenosyltransferase [Methanoregulaceae archaeon]|jgi:S-adenosylmethionine synthetase|nr:methionine adenosyltransferase [Methanolinea sp.]MCC7567351.1 methionine adenosyltransferase [Methanoregulaceae archaeon]MDD3090753.1 methionine adenosyltransferase [Methanoregulaceae archaeon]MDD5048235.1 methionine adenosyltransferase [Methanoregulaceae archaeon]MDD5685380.1 methionine adenosyltransferase [Methanoregulaceae archaeon]
MKRNIRVEALHQVPLEQQQIELVERKCIGHPDSLADGIAESVSRALSMAYLEECGAILHHNTDQGEIVAGESIPKYGGGKIIKPIYMLINGRATKKFDGIDIPTDSIALEATRNYFRKTLTNLDLDRDIIIDCKLGTGSTDLRDVFRPCQDNIPRANDTSFGVGHAPFSETETIVKAVSDYIDEVLRPKHPAIGHDIKIMGLRDADTITLTLACAVVDRYCSGLAEYCESKDILQEHALSVAQKFTNRNVVVDVNTADDINSGSVFLTVTGTSAEMGDDGSVGRGNRCNGLITPNRPMSMEATSGKNPINHIGKIYNILATQLGQECVQKVDGIEEIYIRLLSQIGKPIDQPLVASIQILPSPEIRITEITAEVEGIIDEGLANITCITEKIIRGEVGTF